MLSVGHVTVKRGEILQLSFQGRMLRLLLVWPWMETPILFDLMDASALRFEHLMAEPVAIPVKVQGWRAHPTPDRGCVVVELSMVVGGLGRWRLGGGSSAGSSASGRTGHRHR